MKWILIAAMVAGFMNTAVAALPEVDIAPTGSNGEINGGRVTLSWGFGAGAPIVTPYLGASERAEGIGGGATTQDSGVVAHFKNNWGKWASGLALAFGVYKVADNNDWLPWSDDDKAAPAASTASDAGASSAEGGMAVNGSDNVVINVSNGGSVTVYQDSPITTTTEGGE